MSNYEKITGWEILRESFISRDIARLALSNPIAFESEMYKAP